MCRGRSVALNCAGGAVRKDVLVDLKCHECGVQEENYVVMCDWCPRGVCFDHEDVLENRGIDSDLTLCVDCGDRYDIEHGVIYSDEGDVMSIVSCTLPIGMGALLRSLRVG